MPAARTFLFFLSLTVHSAVADAQAPALDVQAGLGYARAFDGGGVSLLAAVDRALAPPTSPLQHAVGLSFWYAHTAIASTPDEDAKRNLVGLGVRYHLALQRCCGSIHPFVAVPLQVLRSSIVEGANVQPDLSGEGVPRPPPALPPEDVEDAWGWGAGLELGVQLGLAENLGAHTSVQGLYQDIYRESSSNGAWNWHAGLTYRFGR